MPVVVGTGAGVNTLILGSTDGLTWEKIPIPNNYFAAQCVTYGSGRFVAGGSTIITSSDGVSWAFATNANALVEDVIYANGWLIRKRNTPGPAGY